MITFYSQLRHYLLITLTSCFILGLALSFHYPLSSSLILISYGFFSFLALSFTLFRNDGAAVLLLSFCFIAAGLWHGSQNIDHAPPAADISNVLSTGQEAVLVGTLARMVTGDLHGQEIIVDSAFVRKKDTIRLTPVSGRVLLRLKQGWPETITPGDSFAARGVFKKPSAAKSPGLFDYKKHLAEKEIYLIGTVRSPLLIHEIDSALYRDNFTDFFYSVERIRTSIASFLTRSLPDDHAALYQAVLLGDKSKISPDLLDDFKRTGIAHILAISGMHMALLGFFLFSLFYFLTRLSPRLILAINVRKLSMILCIGPLLLYTLLAGSNTPVLRSFIMSLIFILAFCVNRPKSHLSILAAAAFIILFIDPLSLKSASFQLSFAAVGSIVLITPRLLAFVPFYRPHASGQGIGRLLFKRTAELGAITVSATIGTLPLLIYHFNQLSTVTLPANFIVEPLICFWALPCGFIALPLLFIYPPLAKTVLKFGSLALDLTTSSIAHLSTIPLSVLWLPDINIFWIILYYAPFLLFVAPPSRQLRVFVITAHCSALIMILTPISALTNKFRTTDTVSFIDVGQGSSNLIQLAGGKTILIDAGARTTPGFNCGEKIIAPYLWSLGIGRIDDIILTHADADHYNGMSALFERFRPARLWLPANQSGKPGYHRLISQALDRGIKVEYPQDGIFISDRLTTLARLGGSTGRLRNDGDLDDSGTDNNDNSLIVSFRARDFSILFPGDISASRERRLIAEEMKLEHDILLSPHHGSSTSNSNQFLERVSPEYMIVSARTSDNELFPSAATRATAKHLGITMLTTGRNGTVTVKGRNGGFEITASANRY